MISPTETSNYAPLMEPTSAPVGSGFDLGGTGTGASLSPGTIDINQPPRGPGDQMGGFQNLLNTLNQMLEWLRNVLGQQQPTTQPPGNTTPPGNGVDLEPSPSPNPGDSDKPPGTGFDPNPKTEIPNQDQKASPNKKQTDIGKQISNSREFLWKPESDKDGKLAILLPKRITGRVKSVKILSPDGSQVLAKGKYSGVGNGDREHYRFNKAGGKYPDGAIVVVELEDGRKVHQKIGETSDRFER